MAYPVDANSYRILHEIGSGVSAVVYKAACLSLSSAVVAIKSIDLERSRANLEDVRREAKAMALLSHPNVLQAHCSFTVDRHLWVVMPFMAAGSLQSIVSSSFPDGLPEQSIAVVLKEVLRALSYLHGQGHIHRDIKAGNILLNSDGSVKLADFGVSASIYESNLSSSASLYMSSSSSSFFNDMAGTPYWMAPEVIHSHMGYGIKADIWSFGVTALELAHGRPPLSHLPLSKSLLMKITNRLGLDESSSHGKENRKGGNGKKKKKFSKAFKDMVDACLAQDPSKRPSADKLLRHPFFKNCKTTDYLVKNMLQAVPRLEERFKVRRTMTVSIDDADADGMVDEAVSPVTKNRRLSGWIFDEDAVEVKPVFPEDIDDKRAVRNNRYEGEETADRACNPDAAAVFPTECNKGHDGGKVADHGRKMQGEKKACGVEYEGDEKYEDKQEVKVDGAACQAQGTPPAAAAAAATSVLQQFLVPNLVSLLNSLDLQRGVVMDVLARCGCGGVLQGREEEHTMKQQQLWGYLLSVQQTVNDLNLQLQREMKRNAQLQEEVEKLKKKMMGGEGRGIIKTANLL